ncbi:porin [Thalassobius sp. I31.1]|uniref:porin n=1 Tax=Thalassobius sp. I31.1 TaxID=2109912 RepID=UPI000D19B1E3|nr:porin [Thalassobius sp. I31.1]
MPFGGPTLNGSLMGVGGRFGVTENLSFEAGYQKVNFDSLVDGFDMYQIDLSAAYAIGGGFSAGVFFDMGEQSFGSNGIDYRLYGLEGMYENGPFSASAYIGQGKADIAGAPFDPTSDIYGLSVGYEFANGIDIGAFYNRESTDDFGDDSDEKGIHAGYDLSNALNVPVYVTASYSSIDVGGGDSVDRMTLGLTYTFGGKPANSRVGLTRHGVNPNLFSGLPFIGGPI